MSHQELIIFLDAVGALAVLGTVLALALARTGSRSQDLDARMRRFAEAGGGLPIDSAPAETERSRGLRALVARLRTLVNRSRAERTPRAQRTSEALGRADLKLRPREWYLMRVGTILLGAAIGLGIYRSVVFGAILAVVGIFVPPLYLRFRERRRLRRFSDQLGDTLVLLSNALKAGYSFPQAMASIAQSAEPPVSEEFARATREVQLGVSTDEALGHMVSRIQSDDLDLVVTAVQVQRVVGGNLAEILDNIAFTIRERVRIKGEIRTLTAQARASSYIITGLPVVLVLILQAINPTYLAPMFNTAGPGPYVVGLCLASIGVAFYAMRRIANIEV